MNDLIDKQAVMDAMWRLYYEDIDRFGVEIPETFDAERACEAIETVPCAQPEPLTDKEQRIFLAAMDREEKVCEEVDRNYVREPYENSLVSVCRGITRKVKGALWS